MVKNIEKLILTRLTNGAGIGLHIVQAVMGFLYALLEEIAIFGPDDQ